MKKLIFIFLLVVQANAAFASALIYGFEGEVTFTNEGPNNSFSIGDTVNYSYLISLDRDAEFSLVGDAVVTTFSVLDGLPAYYAEYLGGDLPSDPVQNNIFESFNYGNHTPVASGFYSAIQTFLPSLSFLFPTNFDSTVYDWDFGTAFTLQNIWVNDNGEEFALEAQLNLISISVVNDVSASESGVLLLLGSLALLYVRRKR
ncbi:hypothetical protein [Glaciecola sp. 1036]|uniref:hypothetical protein n=1 Tax=Alteromonadaceae TaxID=72275 RepID=UPI003D08C721